MVKDSGGELQQNRCALKGFDVDFFDFLLLMKFVASRRMPIENA
jgi:hypothetical protein